MRTPAVALSLMLLVVACSDSESSNQPVVPGPGDAGSADAPSDSDGNTSDATPGEDATVEPDASEAGPAEAGNDASLEDVGTDAPDCGAATCTCTLAPTDPSTACWHSFGGRYAHGACSASYQCCDGAFVSGTGSCGPCTCTETTGEIGCVAPADGTETCYPAFEGSVGPLDDQVRDKMTGVSWRPECPVGLDDLSLVRFSHLGFDGERHTGEVVVATDVADVILDVFERLYRARFPIAKARLVDEYDASDDASMADDNTSAFNCRAITGGTSWSQHAYGNAIDINPIENPYVNGSLVLPPAGGAYANRSDVRPGMVVEPGPVTGAFRVHGWGWGGSWSSFKDYQHFSANGL